MKPLLLGLLGLALSTLSPLRASELPYLEDWGRLLERFVTPDGVFYRAWASDPSARADLASVVRDAGAIPLHSLTDTAAKAHLINVYNANMIHLVLEDWPVESVATMRPDFGIFKEEAVPLDGGSRVSLDHVEKGLLLPLFKDPRIHFAVNCASFSCPPLLAVPFAPATLETQLEAVTRNFATHKEAVVLDSRTKTLKVSSLFDWYAADFGNDPVTYLNRYRDSPLPSDYQLAYLPYNWALNLLP